MGLCQALSVSKLMLLVPKSHSILPFPITPSHLPLLPSQPGPLFSPRSALCLSQCQRHTKFSCEDEDTFSHLLML